MADTASLQSDLLAQILAAGDDWTDEDMFQVLPATAMTIRVGVRPTAANYLLADQQDLIALLEKLMMADLG